jgi:hypothetical protein
MPYSGEGLYFMASIPDSILTLRYAQASSSSHRIIQRDGKFPLVCVENFPIKTFCMLACICMCAIVVAVLYNRVGKSFSHFQNGCANHQAWMLYIRVERCELFLQNHLARGLKRSFGTTINKIGKDLHYLMIF